MKEGGINTDACPY